MGTSKWIVAGFGREATVRGYIVLRKTYCVKKKLLLCSLKLIGFQGRWLADFRLRILGGSSPKCAADCITESEYAMKTQSIAEAAVAYGTAIADLQQPLILQQEGQPLAVLVSFEDYQRWQALAIDEAQRRQAGWQTLENLLADVHHRTSDYTPEQIESEIQAARAEVKQARNEHRRSH